MGAVADLDEASAEDWSLVMEWAWVLQSAWRWRSASAFRRLQAPGLRPSLATLS